MSWRRWPLESGSARLRNKPVLPVTSAAKGILASTIGGRPGSVAYAASKAAVDVFTVGLAKEVAAEGIRINAVRPGVTRTDMTGEIVSDPERHQQVAATIPIRRIAEVDEVAKPILWLLSEEASFVTGALLDVSGGGFALGAIQAQPSASGYSGVIRIKGLSI